MTLAGDKLSDSKAIVDTGKEAPLPAAVRDTHKALSKKIYRLETLLQPCTALVVLVHFMYIVIQHIFCHSLNYRMLLAVSIVLRNLVRPPWDLLYWFP